MSISQTKRVSQFATSRVAVLSHAKELYGELKDLCYKRLWPNGAQQIIQVELQGTIMSFYPQYNLFMPSIEWISENLTSSHSSDLCLKEATAARDLMCAMPEGLQPVMKMLLIKSGFSGSFSSRFREMNSESQSSNYKTLFEIGQISNFSNGGGNDVKAAGDALYRYDGYGKSLPVICPCGGVWKSLRKDDAFAAVLACHEMVADKELAPLLDCYARIDAALPNENTEVDWDALVEVLSETDRHSDSLLESESTRMNHQRLPEKVLKDPNQGHWDAWPTNSAEADSIEVRVEDPIYARNPLADVDKTGVIGIDFGTKSTIVAKWSSGDPEVLRIGLDDFAKAPEPHHYENPTMMEFIDIKAFQKTYIGKRGRPHTRWADLKTSHEASGDLDGLGSNDVELSQAFFSGLKQWAGYGDQKVIINDTTGNAEQELSPYEELKPGDFDPIEIYAYHIGLAVNNMSERKIVLKYLLSFPATFTSNAQQRILGSFKKGIMRSLPQAVLEDKETMKSFRVEGGTSEPAAYAVCALKTLGLTPEDNHSIPYAVFDFGGGTTDFDFGLWRLSTDEEMDDEDVDWAIEHFGSGGDAFLGGENLLEDIAYLVYVANRDSLVTKDHKYPFAPPHDTIKRAAGYETLLVDSREGRMNRYRIAEKLRSVWEENPGTDKEFESGTLKVALFDIGGGKAQDVELRLEVEKLRLFIRERIARCVDSFVESMQRAFAMLDPKKKKQLDCPIHIFLAGNSSKSHYVKELMEEKLASVQKAFEKALAKEKRENVDMFCIHAPLGCEGGDVLQNVNQTEVGQGEVEGEGAIEGKEEAAIDFSHAPTGKTGVAFGLVESAPGRRIKVVNANKTASGETHFRYFVGRDRRELLVPLLNPESLGSGWVDFCSAGKTEGISYLYYTRDGRGQTGNYKVKDAFCVPVEFDPTEGRILIRASGVSEIEWCVGSVSNDGKCRPSKNSTPKKIQLVERS